MRTAVVAAGLASLVAMFTAAPAPAADNSFDGSCHVTGTTVFGKPLGGQPQDDTYTFTSTPGKSTCSGTLNGKDVSSAPIEAYVSGNGTLSCVASQSGDPGKGYIDFTKGTSDPSDDTVISATLEFVGVATEVAIDIKGTKSGEAGGRASFLMYAGDATQQCNNNALKQIGFDADFQTFSPLTSEAPAASSSTSGGSTGTGGGGSTGGGSTGGGSTGSGSAPQQGVAGVQYSGGPSCVVPKLIGRRLARAKRMLVKAHCRAGKITKKRGARIRGKRARSGTVVGQRPKAGAKKPAGYKVALVVAK